MGSHRVPHAHEVHRRPSVSVHRALLPPRLRPGRARLVALGLVEAEGLVDLVGAVSGDEATLVEHPSERPHGVGAPAEAEEEDLVAGVVVLDEEAVPVLHVLLEAEPEGAAAHLAVVRADPPVVEDHLAPPVARDRPHRAGHAEHVGGVVVEGIVPGAIRADDDALGHGILLACRHSTRATLQARRPADATDHEGLGERRRHDGLPITSAPSTAHAPRSTQVDLGCTEERTR